MLGKGTERMRDTPEPLLRRLSGDLPLAIKEPPLFAAQASRWASS